MQFKRSKYYNRGFLGENLYKNIRDVDEIFTIQEFFNINNVEKEYHIEDEKKDYKIKIYKDHYELNCKSYDSYLYLVFNKPVHIIGHHCEKVFAPEVIIKCKENSSITKSIANKVVVNNSYENEYCITSSKINNIHFYNEKVFFNETEINNFFVFNKDLFFNVYSSFLNYHKIKCIGSCRDLKNKVLYFTNFKEGIIHIE